MTDDAATGTPASGVPAVASPPARPRRAWAALVSGVALIAVASVVVGCGPRPALSAGLSVDLRPTAAVLHPGSGATDAFGDTAAARTTATRQSPTAPTSPSKVVSSTSVASAPVTHRSASSSASSVDAPGVLTTKAPPLTGWAVVPSTAVDPPGTVSTNAPVLAGWVVVPPAGGSYPAPRVGATASSTGALSAGSVNTGTEPTQATLASRPTRESQLAVRVRPTSAASPSTTAEGSTESSRSTSTQAPPTNDLSVPETTPGVARTDPAGVPLGHGDAVPPPVATVDGVWFGEVCAAQRTLRTLGPRVVGTDFSAQKLAVRRSYIHLASAASGTAVSLAALTAPSYDGGQVAKAHQIAAFEAVAAGYGAGARLIDSPAVATPDVLGSTVAQVEADVRARVQRALSGSPAIPTVVQTEIEALPACSGLT